MPDSRHTRRKKQKMSDTLTAAQKRFYADIGNYCPAIRIEKEGDDYYARCIYGKERVKMEEDEGLDCYEPNNNLWCKIPMDWAESPNSCFLDVFVDIKKRKGTMCIVIENIDGYAFKNVSGDASFRFMLKTVCTPKDGDDK